MDIPCLAAAFAVGQRPHVAMRGFSIVLLVVLGGSLAGCKVATVRPIGQARAATSPAADGRSRGTQLWQHAVPAARAAALPVSQLYAELEREPERTAARGHRAGEGAVRFVVSGRGRVTAVDAARRTGTAQVALETPAGPREVTMQMGPLIRGTDVRDALPQVAFDDFADQIQYAEASVALNERVERDVLGALDRGGLVGLTVTFTAVLRHLPGEPVVLTPLALEVAP